MSPASTRQRAGGSPLLLPWVAAASSLATGALWTAGQPIGALLLGALSLTAAGLLLAAGRRPVGSASRRLAAGAMTVLAAAHLGAGALGHAAASPNLPPILDAARAGGHLALLLGVLSLARRTQEHADTDGVDAVVIGVAGGAALWVLVGSAPALILPAAAWGALLAALSRVLLTPVRRTAAGRLMGGGAGALLAADLLPRAAPALAESAWLAGVAVGAWAAGALLVGASASFDVHTDVGEATPRHRRLPLILAVVALPFVARYQVDSAHWLLDAAALLLAGGAVAALVAARNGRLARVAEERRTQLAAQQRTLRQSLQDRAALTKQLRHQAFHDSLTGLGNRTLFVERLEDVLSASRISGAPLAVLFYDLDGFKEVNDTLGHRAGDELLQVVASRVRGAVRPGDTVTRLGGDEFAVLLPRVGEQEAWQVAERILDAVSKPLTLSCGPVQVGGSIGIAYWSSSVIDAEELLRRADVAMYVAKRTPGSGIAAYDEASDGTVDALVSASELAHAVTEGQLRVHYQPIVDLETERIVGVEALVRWDHPRQGLLLPESFLDMATALGLATAIDFQVLETAVAQLGRWRRGCDGGADLFASINLCPSALLDPRLVPRLEQALSEAGVPPAVLAVEVTEQTVAAGPGDVANRIHELRALGVRIALDDFGTGYSSLSRLMELPVDVLKIDRAFSQSLPGGGDQRNLASYVVELGRICELTTVAEGVETRAQADILKQHGCTFAQGFLFADPLPADRIAPLLSAGSLAAVAADPEDVAGR